MDFIPVHSSDVSSVGYENGTLYVRFHSGGLYAYFGVPESVFQAFLSAPSKGSFLQMQIRGRYSYQRIG